MKQGTGVSASLMAMLSSVATISCCLPLGFAAALGAGAASSFFTTLRPWLLGLSVLLLGLGFWQQHRAKQCSIRGRLIGNVLLWAALVVVLGMILFPREIVAFIADRFLGRLKRKRLIGVAAATVIVLLAAAYLWGPGSAPRGQEAVVTLSKRTPGEFEKAFDAESEVPRLVLLLSPT